MNGTFASGGMVDLISYEMESLEVYGDALRCLGFQTADAIIQLRFGLKVTELQRNKVACWLVLTSAWMLVVLMRLRVGSPIVVVRCLDWFQIQVKKRWIYSIQ